MPSWWAEFLTLLHTFALPFVLLAVTVGIIIRFLVGPYLGKIAKAFHQTVLLVYKIHEAGLHPERKDKKGNPHHIHRHEILSALEKNEKLLFKFCDASHCPVVPIAKSEFEEVRKSLVTLTTMKEAFLEAIKREEKRDEVFLAKILEMREDTQKKIDDSYTRINQFMDEVLTRREIALDKKDEMLAKAMSVLERVASEKKNGRP